MYRYPPLLLLTPSLPYLAGQLIRSKLFAHSSGTTAVNISDVRMRPVALVVNLLSFSLIRSIKFPIFAFSDGFHVSYILG